MKYYFKNSDLVALKKKNKVKKIESCDKYFYYA